MPVDPAAASHEPHPDARALTGYGDESKVDYTPHPERSIELSPERREIVRKICNLYSGSANEENMMVYVEKAVYDDPLSFCRFAHFYPTGHEMK